MALSAKQVNQNYLLALKLSSRQVQNEFQKRGYDADARQELQENLAQSALADSAVVELLQTTVFNDGLYAPIIHEALLQVKREMFADVDKRRFVSIDRSDYYKNNLAIEIDTAPTALHVPVPDILKRLDDTLEPDVRAYLQELILGRAGNRNLLQHRLLARSGYGTSAETIQKISQNIRRIKKLFPDGVLHPERRYDGRAEMTATDIINCYKNILTGIDHSFPSHFLKVDAKNRAALLVRFLLDSYLKKDPEDVLGNENSAFFIRYGIQNIYRFFNYSMNRVLYNAYPERIMPWMRSRIGNNFWEAEENRVNAVRWLVEDRLGLEPTKLKKQVPGRNAFAENGLSYLFSVYYNSVSKALQEAYPDLEPWQIGNVPGSYWTDENATRAVRTMIRQNDWRPEQLVQLYKCGALKRATFGQAGLTTVFQVKYGRNIFRAISAAYPGMFEPWELGKVPSVYWSNKKHIANASQWIAAQEGIGPIGIPSAIRSQHLSFKTLKKYPIGRALKQKAGNSFSNLFLPFFNREQRGQSDELRIRKKIRRLIRNEQSPHPLMMLLFYGFYLHLVSQASSEYLFRIQRIKQRRQRYKVQ